MRAAVSGLVVVACQSVCAAMVLVIHSQLRGAVRTQLCGFFLFVALFDAS